MRASDVMCGSRASGSVFIRVQGCSCCHIFNIRLRRNDWLGRLLRVCKNAWGKLAFEGNLASCKDTTAAVLPTFVMLPLCMRMVLGSRPWTLAAIGS